jgi:hypothetical protein
MGLQQTMKCSECQFENTAGSPLFFINGFLAIDRVIDCVIGLSIE